MDQKAIDAQHRLLAKISDPDAKSARSGAQVEGRELHVTNVDFIATEEDVRELFEPYGKVENVRMLKNAVGRPTGTVFVVYSTSVSRHFCFDSSRF